MLHLDTTLSIAMLDLVVDVNVLISKTSLGDLNKTMCVFCNSSSLPNLL